MIFCFEKDGDDRRINNYFYCFDECYIFSEKFDRGNFSYLIPLVSQWRRPQ